MADSILTVKVAGDDVLLEFPVDVTREILSYVVEEKDGARASCLSNLKYDEYVYKKSFPGRKDFYHHVIRSLQRCREQNISIEKLTLTFSGTLPDDNEWIQILIDTGVKHLRVWAFDSVLPSMVFEVESFVSLSVDYLGLEVPKSIKFRNLKYLDLFIVTLDQQNLDSIFSACQMIETLKIWKCNGFENLKVTNLPNLEHFLIQGILEPPQSVEIEAPNLKQLELHEVNIPAEYDLSFRFPLLEHSVIHPTCDRSECSHSFEER